MSIDSATSPLDRNLNPRFFRREKTYLGDRDVSATGIDIAINLYDVAASGRTGRLVPASNDNTQKYGLTLRVMAVLSVAFITFGLAASVLYPNVVTGIAFPLGLLLFWITGIVARKSSRK